VSIQNAMGQYWSVVAANADARAGIADMGAGVNTVVTYAGA
jgi:hypothetical protein